MKLPACNENAGLPACNENTTLPTGYNWNKYVICDVDVDEIINEIKKFEPMCSNRYNESSNNTVYNVASRLYKLNPNHKWFELKLITPEYSVAWTTYTPIALYLLALENDVEVYDLTPTLKQSRKNQPSSKAFEDAILELYRRIYKKFPNHPHLQEPSQEKTELDKFLEDDASLGRIQLNWLVPQLKKLYPNSRFIQDLTINDVQPGGAHGLKFISKKDVKNLIEILG
ncbi:hypothetical protein OAG24_00175 [bacterium]|nr:hypothetical protein [bacterium]